MDREHVINQYIGHVLDHGKPPNSVHSFAKDHELNEREFFTEFGSFEALESGIWQKLTHESIEAIENGEEWSGFTARQKLLTFNYAFCDKILEHRSFFLLRFPRLNAGKVPPRGLGKMRETFAAFAERLVQAGIENQEISGLGPLSRTYPQAFFGHLLTVIEFNLADDSKGFERTDAFIEKSVRLAFDVIGTQAVDSAFDLVRFLAGQSHSKS